MIAFFSNFVDYLKESMRLVLSQREGGCLTLRVTPVGKGLVGVLRGLWALLELVPCPGVIPWAAASYPTWARLRRCGSAGLFSPQGRAPQGA